MILFQVKIKYMDDYSKDEFDDEWYVGAKDNGEVRDFMMRQREEFRGAGFDLYQFSVKEISNTQNGYQIKLEEGLSVHE